SVRFLVSQFRDFTNAVVSSTTIDFSWVTSYWGLLSMTSTPPASSFLRDSLFSDSPSRRAGFSMTRTFKPRCLAPITAFKSDGSEKTNILTRRDFFAPFMLSRIGCAESSGRTIKERGINPPWDHFERDRCLFPKAPPALTNYAAAMPQREPPGLH